MSVITFTNIRDEAVEQIKAAFVNNKIHIAAHPGQFNETEIRSLANQTPAVLTSFMGYDDDTHTIDFVSWVLHRSDNKDRLYNGALNIASALIPVIRNLDCEWSIDIPGGIKAECLYTGCLDQINNVEECWLLPVSPPDTGSKWSRAFSITRAGREGRQYRHQYQRRYCKRR